MTLGTSNQFMNPERYGGRSITEVMESSPKWGGRALTKTLAREYMRTARRESLSALTLLSMGELEASHRATKLAEDALAGAGVILHYLHIKEAEKGANSI